MFTWDKKSYLKLLFVLNNKTAVFIENGTLI